MKKIAIAAILMSVLAGCASGPKYTEMQKTTPVLAKDQGRVIFYREASILGAALQPNISVNNKVVGQSLPGGYFYFDTSAGSYKATTGTDADSAFEFNVLAQETKYIKTSPSFGLIIGSIGFKPVDTAIANQEIQTLSYAPLKQK